MTDTYLTRQASRLVDQRAMDEYGVRGIVLMENAGRGCADKLCELGIDGSVVVCCGSGNNAGDGYVIARHLDLRGADVRVLQWSPPDKLRGDAATNWQILQRTRVPTVDCSTGYDIERLQAQLEGAHWVVDALLGTGVQGAPRPPLDGVIQQLNAMSARRLAVDLPSGLDPDTGQPSPHTFRADHTCTFVAPKIGFREPAAQAYLGQVHVLDIGVRCFVS